jgi:hypothetical protein
VSLSRSPRSPHNGEGNNSLSGFRFKGLSLGLKVLGFRFVRLHRGKRDGEGNKSLLGFRVLGLSLGL